jgi:thiol-disulfide isomerase/thioredoxin
MKFLSKPLYFSLLSLLFIACSGSDGGSDGPDDIADPVITELILNYDNDILFKGDLVTFKVTDNLGRILSYAAEFEIDGVALSGNSITLANAGEQTLKISHEGYSQEFDLKVYNSSYTQKILIEDYTGTWCGYCPRVSLVLDDLTSSNENVIASAIHNGDNMVYQFEAQMRDAYDVGGFPWAKLNRIHRWNESPSSLTAFLNKSPGLGLSINSAIEGDDLNVEIGVGFDLSRDDLKLVVYFQRNGMIANQANFYNEDSSTPFFDLGNPIEGFVHDHVLLSAFTDVFGDQIPASEVAEGSVYNTSLSKNLNSLSYDAAFDGDFEIVAFVMNADGEVVNVQKALIGEAKDFD